MWMLPVLVLIRLKVKVLFVLILLTVIEGLSRLKPRLAPRPPLPPVLIIPKPEPKTTLYCSVPEPLSVTVIVPADVTPVAGRQPPLQWSDVMAKVSMIRVGAAPAGSTAITFNPAALTNPKHATASRR